MKRSFMREIKAVAYFMISFQGFSPPEKKKNDRKTVGINLAECDFQS